MSEVGKFFLTQASSLTGDQVVGYSNVDLQEFNRTAFMTDPTAEGVMRGALNALAVSGTVTQVSVNTGYAMVYGLWYKNDLAFNIAIPPPTVSTRVDRIVARANMTSSTYAGQTGYTVRVVRITQSEGISTDVGLTQNSSQWEIPLAKVSITTGGAITVTDQRTFLRPPVQISGDNLTSTVTYTGQFVGTKTGGGTAGAIFLNSANPFIGVASTTGSTDTKNWDFGTLATDNSFVIRTGNDANSVATQAVQITRSGTTVSAINLKAPTNVTGAFAASAGISGTTGSFSGTLAAGATTITGTVTATNASIAGVVNAGSASISGTMTSNNASVAGLTATGTFTASGTATITGATATGALTVTGNASVSGNTTLTGTLASGALSVTGNMGATGAVTGATGAITGLLTAGSITTSGTMTSNNAAVTGLVASATMTASTSVTSPSFVGTLTGSASAIADGAVSTAAKLASNVVTTAKILDANVTKAKLENMSAATVLGQPVGGSGAPAALSAAQLIAVINTGGAVANATAASTATSATTASSATNATYAATAGDANALGGRAAATFPVIQRGSFTVNIAGGVGTQAFTFGTSFAGTPSITYGVNEPTFTTPFSIVTRTKSASGATVFLYNSLSTTGTITIDWIAAY